MLKLDFSLNESQIAELRKIDPKSFFAQIGFQNVSSPRHAVHGEYFEEINRKKMDMLAPWIGQCAPGRSVLDLFCANGMFSFLACQYGATRVLGVDFEQLRTDCANRIASFIPTGKYACAPRFLSGDVYRLCEIVGSDSYDVGLVLGGLYHIADPPFILRQVRQVVREYLIVQTSSVVFSRGSWARFKLRRDRQDEGLSSYRGRQGVWHVTVECFENMLTHAGFEVIERKLPCGWRERRRFPWYGAIARPI